ncbi:hypothetical protein ACFL3Z_00435, partial [Gemmatimonadota bacterium]
RATNAYLNMPVPPRRTGSYALEYVQSRIRLAESHINLGEWGGALDALEEAVTFEGAGHSAYLLLGQAQCTVGRFGDGRATLERIAGMAPTIPSGERATAHALAGYQKANCAHQEFIRAQASMDILRTGSAAIREYDAFIQQGEAVDPPPPPVAAALEQARTRIEEIRERMRGGGGR